MIAPPWITIPPDGYGGTELVIYSLARQLAKMDVEVELFSISKSRIRGVKVNSYYPDEQFEHLYKPLYDASPIPIAHVLFALNAIQQDGKFDIIHDHNGFIGPLALYFATQQPKTPPALHTLHNPQFIIPKSMTKIIPSSLPMWRQFKGAKGLYFVGISKSLIRNAPKELKPRMLPIVHNGIDPEKFPLKTKKRNYFITLGRFSQEKGQHMAAELCEELGFPLDMAGTVASIGSERQLVLELANPLSEYRNYVDFRYYSDKIWPITVKNPRIKYIGNIQGNRKLRFLSNARALLNPIDWEEPFGLTVIEAMACGTPVIAMKRGAMPEIIKHGFNGFLATNKREFRQYINKIDEINPEDCRSTVQERFSSAIMASNYLDRYHEILGTKKRT